MNGVHYSVDNDKRLVGRRDRAGTAYTNRCAGAGLARGAHDIGTGDTALKSLVDREYRSVLDIAHLDIGH